MSQDMVKAGPKADLNSLLLGPPYLDDEAVSALDETERRREFPREIDLGIDE